MEIYIGRDWYYPLLRVREGYRWKKLTTARQQMEQVSRQYLPLHHLKLL